MKFKEKTKKGYTVHAWRVFSPEAWTFLESLELAERDTWAGSEILYYRGAAIVREVGGYLCAKCGSVKPIDEEGPW